MGFCLLNSIGITAAALVEAGERVAIVDFDAHHGNGTQDAFYDSDQVLFVSLHQYPWYGHRARRGGGWSRVGYTVNIPLRGHGRRCLSQCVRRRVWPKIEQLPTILVSAGFDGHRLDPLAQLGLTSGDYGDLARKLVAMVPPGRLIAHLEGGYHLDSLAASVAATVGRSPAPVAPKRPRRGRADDVIAAVRAQHGLADGSTAREPAVRPGASSVVEVRPLSEAFAAPGFHVSRRWNRARPLRRQRQAPDIDLTTDATPEEIERVRRTHRRCGSKARSARSDAAPGRVFEITTHRSEAYLSESSKPM